MAVVVDFDDGCAFEPVVFAIDDVGVADAVGADGVADAVDAVDGLDTVGFAFDDADYTIGAVPECVKCDHVDSKKSKIFFQVEKIIFQLKQTILMAAAS